MTLSAISSKLMERVKVLVHARMVDGNDVMLECVTHVRRLVSGTKPLEQCAAAMQCELSWRVPHVHTSNYFALNPSCWICGQPSGQEHYERRGHDVDAACDRFARYALVRSRCAKRQL